MEINTIFIFLISINNGGISILPYTLFLLISIISFFDWFSKSEIYNILIITLWQPLNISQVVVVSFELFKYQ